MRRTAVLLLAFVLALAAGVALIAASTVVRTAPSSRGSSEANKAVVLGFYAAVNGALRSGRPPVLDDIIAAHVLAGGRPSDDEPPTPFQETIDGIMSAFAGQQLTVESVIAEGSQVAAMVLVTGSRSDVFPGLPVHGPATGWPLLDRFRLDDGEIVALDHWDQGRDLVVAQPLLAATLDRLPATPTIVEVNRVILPPGAHLTGLIGPGPEVLLVETGRLALSVVGQARLDRGSGPVSVEGDISLDAGNLLVVPTGAPFTVDNVGQVAAVILEVALRSTAERSADNDGIDASALSAAELAWNVSVHRLVAGLVTDLPAGPATIDAALLTLTPGAGISRHGVAGAELFAIASGGLDLTLSVGTGHLQKDRGTDLFAAPGSPSFGTEALSQTGSLSAGESAFLPMGAGYQIHNPATVPLVMLFVRITPATGATGP